MEIERVLIYFLEFDFVFNVFIDLEIFRFFIFRKIIRSWFLFIIFHFVLFLKNIPFSDLLKYNVCFFKNISFSELLKYNFSFILKNFLFLSHWNYYYYYIFRFFIIVLITIWLMQLITNCHYKYHRHIKSTRLVYFNIHL